MTFLGIRFLDFLDIFLVAMLLFQIYKLLQGGVAINIFVGVFTTYLAWLIVRALNMQLLGLILGQVMGVGAVALVIVFQQEIRRLFMMAGTRYLSNLNFSLENMFSWFTKKNVEMPVDVDAIVQVSENLSQTRTGALIVLAQEDSMTKYIESGDLIRARTSSRLLETIFFKNSPLHDGAVIISGKEIVAARCVLPVSENMRLPANLGLRHRSALGIAEVAEVFVIIVSEETGNISYASKGKLTTKITPERLRELLNEHFMPASHMAAAMRADAV